MPPFRHALRMSFDTAKAVLAKSFPEHKAFPSSKFVTEANNVLMARGYSKENTLFASSCCSDEINRLLDYQMNSWGEHFQLGGLAGFPFVGRTGFAAYQSHMPEKDGRLFIMCAAHVGVSRAGNLGYCNRPGMESESKACGSALGAYSHLLENNGCDGDGTAAEALAVHDLQQHLITRLVKKHFDDIKKADDPIAKLSLVVAEENYNEVCAIIPPDYDRSEVAILAGLQVNTDTEVDDFFIPLHFKIRGKDGAYQDVFGELMSKLE
ncbi:hypothetical protein PTSG_08963 [Salpingoeca rosetta]|uniref:Limiting CO2-inducible protein B/C beta carbonyic anhydrase domain-containing protein n=1 Tax=Salpingoeca rosetta (strain ATCC 50818 / BSB-021) TaxID=946362 RepID=F2ULT6_SALR5|nr:uncharacterized protein PTSG_08963 [Salpingoeca rosetta]EGD78085.1 hypothetical protein PTSG_08963 [Salpingoeca rosetta]|eukprot:XP_004989761.1 hypothetical protein PTSG_08963 [Salpingoeca rosetta]